jgi:hypothetical protein
MRAPPAYLPTGRSDPSARPGRIRAGKLPGWRNGRRDGLKSHCPKGRVGSNPTPGTNNVVNCRCALRSSRCASRQTTGTGQSQLLPHRRRPGDQDNTIVCGVAIKTIRRWRRLYRRRGLPRGQPRTTSPCPRCTDAHLDREAYTLVLGWYLGDGHIAHQHDGVYSLAIYNDSRYHRLNVEIAEALASIKPGGRVHTRQESGCTEIKLTLKTLAVPISAARGRDETHSSHCPGAVAARNRRGIPGQIPARAFSFRWLSHHQLDCAHGG